MTALPDSHCMSGGLGSWSLLHFTPSPKMKLSAWAERMWRISDITLPKIGPSGSKTITPLRYTYKEPVHRATGTTPISLVFLRQQQSPIKLRSDRGIPDNMEELQEAIFSRILFPCQLKPIWKRMYTNLTISEVCYMSKLDKTVQFTPKLHLRKRVFVDKLPEQRTKSALMQIHL